MKLIGPVLVLLLKLFNLSCRALPTQRWLYRIGSWLGGVTFLLQRKRRETALTNLALIFGDEWPKEKITRVARDSFNAISTIYFELFWQPQQHDVEFDQWARWEGLEHLEAAHALGKGVILACPHLGNWTVLARAIARKGYQFDALMRPAAIPAVRDHMSEELADLGLNITPTPLPKGGFATLIKKLADGAVFMMVADRRANDYLIDFLGHPAWTAHGAATLHLRSGAPIITAYAVRERDYHRLIIEPAIIHPPTDDSEADTLTILQEINNRFSAMIRQHPEQWLWLHERWRGRRKGQQSASNTGQNAS